jgi:hypothetical protein
MNIFNKIIRKLVQINIFWIFLNKIVGLGKRIQVQKNIVNNRPTQKILNNLFSAPYKVLNGPFKGMLYPSIHATGSAIYPKLIGSYEQELHEITQQLIEYPFDEIWDIGCAEGYYAIGFALKNNTAKVLAHDIEIKAQNMCKKMAEINNVSHKISIGGAITPDSFENIDANKKVLILSDCEGYEKHLFTSNTISNLKNCHVLIELHDMFDIEISTKIKAVFEASHHIQMITSNDDIYKAHNYNYSESKNLSTKLRYELFAERRLHIMEWIYAVPK